MVYNRLFNFDIKKSFFGYILMFYFVYKIIGFRIWVLVSWTLWQLYFAERVAWVRFSTRQKWGFESKSTGKLETEDAGGPYGSRNRSLRPARVRGRSLESGNRGSSSWNPHLDRLAKFRWCSPTKLIILGKNDEFWWKWWKMMDLRVVSYLSLHFLKSCVYDENEEIYE